jgi:Na+:H+ antiporter, NhaA family
MWLILPAAAALLVWWRYGHRAAPHESLRRAQRVSVVWPYVLAGLVSWAGVLAAGLPGALGLLPILPAIAHANRSFGLFAEAEGLLHDPLNRLAQMLIWPACAAMFGFGLTYGAIDPSAFGIVTVIMLAALWVGKPAGLLLFARVLPRYPGQSPLLALRPRDLACIAPLFALAFTGPALGLPWTLPPGVVADAARLGLALSLFAAPLSLLIARKLV